MSADPVLRALFRVFSDLPRCAPGSDATSSKAFGLLPALPENPLIADLGCGPGASSLVLAKAARAPVVAVDMHRPYLEALRRKAGGAGLGAFVWPLAGNITCLPFAAGTFDCLWAEGSLYAAGVEEGLAHWKPLLKPGGILAASELCWSEGPRPNPAAEFFAGEYPAMDTEAAFAEKAAGAGFAVLDRLRQPETDWWDAFYTPLEARLQSLSGEAKGDPALGQVIARTRAEITMRRRFPSAYGYTFFVLRAN